MNRNLRIIKNIPKYTTNLEYASAITELSFIVNPSYKESNNVVDDYEWKHYNFIILKKNNEKIGLMFSRHSITFCDEDVWTSVNGIFFTLQQRAIITCINHQES